MEKELEDNQPNYKLGKVLDGLFYKTGNLGFKVLGELMSTSEKKFENYLVTLEKFCEKDKDFDSCPNL